MQNTQKNQGFNAKDVFLVFFFLGAFVAIGMYTFADFFTDKNLVKCKDDVESLTAQIMVGGLKTLPPGAISSRNVASISATSNAPKFQTRLNSEGRIGKDPWGQPFHYKIVSDPKGEARYIVVFSYGPNNTKETELDTTQILLGVVNKNFFHGDDLGHVRSIPK